MKEEALGFAGAIAFLLVLFLIQNGIALVLDVIFR